MDSISREEFYCFKNLVVQSILEIRENLEMKHSRSSILLLLGLENEDVESMEKMFFDLIINESKITKKDLFSKLKKSPTLN